MLDPQPAPWPRPYFTAGDLPTKIFFVCFAKAPLAELPLDRARFGVPSEQLLQRVDVREHRRAAEREWFEGWWGGSFGVIAERDLASDAALLTGSDLCVSLRLELPDQGDLGPLQTLWGISRWLCARGASVVLDVHAFRFRTRQSVEALDFAGSDVQRDVKIVLETDPTREGLHLLHTRGLCKLARPELLCFIRPDDADVMGRFVNQIARTLMEGAQAAQIRLRVADGLELVTAPSNDRALIDSLGLEAAVVLGRSDGAPLAGIGRLVPEA
jgi:hypothetical protein